MLAAWAALALVSSSLVVSAGDLRLLPTPVGVTEMFVSDPRSGLALDGYDPTLYLLEGRAGLGRPGEEAVWGGVAWQFASVANRTAFLHDPAAFLPRIGGYDAEAAARGVLARSDPTNWVRRSGRIYLFRTEAARERFERLPEAAELAERRWPALRAGLVGS